MDNLKLTSFANINLKDSFFDSLRANYEGFDDWFNNKASSGANALVYYNDAALLDFLYMKEKNEALHLDGITLPPKQRLKVGTYLCNIPTAIVSLKNLSCGGTIATDRTLLSLKWSIILLSKRKSLERNSLSK